MSFLCIKWTLKQTVEYRALKEHTSIEHFQLTGIGSVPVLGLQSLLGWAKDSQIGDSEFILVVLSIHSFKSYQFSQAKSEVISTTIFFWEKQKRKLTHSRRIRAKMINMWDKKDVFEFFSSYVFLLTKLDCKL